MRHHQGIHAGGDGGGKRHDVGLGDRRQRPPVGHRAVVAVGLHRSVAGEMLAGGAHAGRLHGPQVGDAQGGASLRVGVEGTLADGLVAARQVQHRGKAQVDADGAHRRRHQPGVFGGQGQGALAVVVQAADAGQRRRR